MYAHWAQIFNFSGFGSESIVDDMQPYAEFFLNHESASRDRDRGHSLATGSPGR